MGLRGFIKGPPREVDGGTTVKEACLAMSREKLGALVVVDDGRASGIFTYRDLIDRVVLKKREPDTTVLADVMTKDVRSLPVDSTYGEVLRTMVEGDYTYLPVVDEKGMFLGTLSLREMLEHEIDHLASELDSVTQYLAVDGPGGD